MKVCSVCQRCYDDDVLSCTEENHEFLVEARAASCEVIANYRLEFLHESSSSGETYRAVNKILKKPYLIKILAPESFDEDSKKQFLRETRALSAVAHPNIARVFESGTLSDGSLYAVTEFFSAQTLRECLENVGSPSEVTALTITRQTAEGLEAIHAVGIQHRNIRPENIILTSDAENRFLVKLQNIDFGAIHQSQVNSNPDLFLSDLRYFSPEQCAAQVADAQSDVYALGVVLFETLAGHVPFDSPYADALITKQINEMPPSVKINTFDIRMLVTHTLTDALQKQARTRLKSANAFARQLRHIEQLATHSSTPPPAVAYPATMVKSAVAFTPPAKIENPVAARIEPLVKELPSLETRTVVEEIPPVIENQFFAEDLSFAENQRVIEEIPPAVEEKFAADELTPAENQAVVEEIPVEIEAQAAIEDVLPAIEAQPVVEALELVEEQPVIEEESPVIELAVEENLPLVEARTVFENLPETQTVFEEERVEVETQTVFEAPLETEMVIEKPVEIEAQTAAEDLIEVEAQTVVEDVTPVAVEAQTVIEDVAPAVVETPAVIEDVTPTAVEMQPVIEDSASVEVQTAAAEVESPEPVFIDLTTTKLPPLETVVEKPLPENIKITEIAPIFSLKSGFLDVQDYTDSQPKVSDIHKTSEPVVIDWEQPDDVPTITQTLDAKAKENADAEFAPPSDFIDDEDDYIIDEGVIDSPPSAVVKGYEYRRDYAAETSVFSSYDSVASWNLPGKRKMLTGVGIFALIVLAVGGTLLSRQFQLASATSKTTAQSTPNDKSLPKSVEPDKVSENDKSSTMKTKNLTINKLSADNDDADVPEIPAYQPRETETKTRTKKRAVKETEEKTGNMTETKSVPNETFDKRGNIKPSGDKQLGGKSPTTIKPKMEIFSRPRIVKTPKN